MNFGTCDNADCTVAATGKCLLSQPSPEDCPHFHDPPTSSGAVLPDTAGEAPSVRLDLPKLSNPAKAPGRKFQWGNELGAADAVTIMRSRYSHLIGVLGSTDAGKTCFLVALYLMASNGRLPKSFKFAGSLSLQAFEDRARGLRKWENGALPGQLVDHTFLSDPRQPSLLHLAIRESESERRRFDLLLTDLPGEWTDNLVNNAKHAESFKFLQRADGIILVVDGNRLISNERHMELQRMRYFCERLATDVAINRSTPIVILVSKADQLGLQMPAAATDLEAYVKSFGFPVTTVLSAAFSRKPEEVPSGTGIFEAVDAILFDVGPDDFISATDVSEQSASRTFQEFKS